MINSTKFENDKNQTISIGSILFRIISRSQFLKSVIIIFQLNSLGPFLFHVVGCGIRTENKHPLRVLLLDPLNTIIKTVQVLQILYVKAYSQRRVDRRVRALSERLANVRSLDLGYLHLGLLNVVRIQVNVVSVVPAQKVQRLLRLSAYYPSKLF